MVFPLCFLNRDFPDERITDLKLWIFWVAGKRRTPTATSSNSKRGERVRWNTAPAPHLASPKGSTTAEFSGAFRETTPSGRDRTKQTARERV
jgi:hypothetical protein